MGATCNSVCSFSAVDHTDKSAADYYAESLAIAEEADRLGFSHARTVEHYFTRYGGYSPNPIVFLTAVSQRTLAAPRHRRGAAGVQPSVQARRRDRDARRHFGGRLDVGSARAFLLHEFRRFGISPDESQARFREGLEQIELLLTQENASHRGQFHSFENVTPLPRPTQTPRPKSYIAATQTPGSVRVRGQQGAFADGNPDRPDRPAHRALPQALARRRPSRRRRGDGGLPHVLPRGRAPRARDRTPPFEE